MNYPFKIIFILIVLYSFNACTKDNNPSNTAYNAPVITINNSSIEGELFLKHLILKLISLEEPNPAFIELETIKKIVVSDLVQYHFVEEYARDHNIIVKKAESDALYKKFTEGKVRSSIYQKLIQRYGFKVHDFKKAIRQQLLIDKALKPLMKNAEEAETTAEQSKYKAPVYPAIKVSQIVFTEKNMAQNIYNILKKEPNKFGEYAREYSISPEAKNGGAIGWVPVDSLKIFKQAYNSYRKKITPPLESDYGFHLIKILDYKKDYSPKSNDEDKKFTLFKEKWIKDKINNSQIKVYRKFIDNIEISGS